MTVVTTEIEIPSSLSAAKLFKSLSDFDTLAPKVTPEIYKSIETIEGDGGVGTIKISTYGDGLPYTTSKQKVDAIDLSNLSFSYTIFEGDILSDVFDSITHHVKFVPSVDGGAVYKHTTVYNCKGETKPTEEILNLAHEAYKKVFKAMEAYVIANAEAY